MCNKLPYECHFECLLFSLPFGLIFCHIMQRHSYIVWLKYTNTFYVYVAMNKQSLKNLHFSIRTSVCLSLFTSKLWEKISLFLTMSFSFQLSVEMQWEISYLWKNYCKLRTSRSEHYTCDYDFEMNKCPRLSILYA